MTTMPDHVLDLPQTREACRARLAELAGDIAAIKTQIAAADLERQRRHARVDAKQFQAWRTALHQKQCEAQWITRHMATLPSRRDASLRRPATFVARPTPSPRRSRSSPTPMSTTTRGCASAWR